MLKSELLAAACHFDLLIKKQGEGDFRFQSNGSSNPPWLKICECSQRFAVRE